MDHPSAPRVSEKFPASTSIWTILRTFEANAARMRVGGMELTEQAVASTNSGAGRLYYAFPVVQIMNRELGTFEDLEKTLAGLGFHSGTALLRVKWRPSEMPYEEAMERIGRMGGGVEVPREGDATAAAGEQTEAAMKQAVEMAKALFSSGETDTAKEESDSIAATAPAPSESTTISSPPPATTTTSPSPPPYYSPHPPTQN